MSKSKKRTSPSEDAVSAPETTVKKIKNVLKVFGEEVKSVEDALKGLKKVLQGAEEVKGLTLEQVQKWCQDRSIKIPWPAGICPSKDFSAQDLTFDFEAPQSIAIAGSFMLQTFLSNSSDSNVDLIIEQPEGVIFRYADGAKDHINWRYWLRRCFYLTVCFDVLKKNLPESALITFDCLNGNPYKSIILIKFTGIDRIIRIIPSLPYSDAFKSKIFRLSPQKSNVRPAWLQSWINGGSKTFDSSSKELPTPFYNYSLLSEALYLPHLVHLHSVLKSSPVLTASIKMIKAWLKQAEISPVTAMNGFTASMWLVNMVNSGIINPSLMDELQIFKLVLKSWVDAFSNGEGKSFFMKLAGFENEEDFEGFTNLPSQQQQTLSLLAGPMNLFYSANPNSLQVLAKLSESTLSFLSSHPDRLDRIFLTKLNCELFIHDLRVTCKNVRMEDVKGLPAGVIENYGNVMTSGYLEGRIALVLRKGLTDRFKGPLSIQIVPKEDEESFDIKIGVTFDTQNYERLIDLGPSSDEGEAAAKFRGFWGSKSELRQFKDSAIRECVSWESVADKSSIPKEIINWLLSRHFGLKPAAIETSGQLDFFKTSAASDAFTKFSGVFDTLSRELRGLSQILPLTIVQCIGISPAHRHTSLQVPEARANALAQDFPSSLLPAPSCPVYDFLIRFERSAAWPDERQALQSARQAFLLQLNRVLLSRKIVQGALVSAEYIDIFYKGYVFRGWIEVPREELRCRAEGLISEAERIERRTFWQTRLSNTLHQLATRHRAYAETARLIKTFLSGHLINLDDDLIDTLVALVFLTGEDQRGSGKASWVGSLLQNRPAGTALTGFLRFLDLLINFPWSERPLILDFTSFESGNEDETTANTSQMEIDAMNSSDWSALIKPTTGTHAVSIIPVFTREQKAMILNSLGNSELSALIPTLPIDLIEKVTLIRCKLLAKLALEHVESSSQDEEAESSIQGLFKMSSDAIINDFDILIKLDAEQIQQVSGHHIEGLTRILRNAPQANPLLFSTLPGFSAPLRLLKELSGPLKLLTATVSYNPSNPVMFAVRVKDLGKIEQVFETVKRIGGDLIEDIKITRQQA